MATGTTRDEAEKDAAVRDAIAIVGVNDVGTTTATNELIEAASASGLACSAVDVACWHRLGTLGGYDSVILVTDNGVIVHVAAGRLSAKASPSSLTSPSRARRRSWWRAS